MNHPGPTDAITSAIEGNNIGRRAIDALTPDAVKSSIGLHFPFPFLTKPQRDTKAGFILEGRTSMKPCSIKLSITALPSSKFAIKDG